jgi:hypothetical protein
VEPPSEVGEHYETEVVEADRLSRGAGRLELVRTQEIVRRYFPPAPLKILDAVEGREAIPFAARVVESEPSVLGASAHLLMVAQRPTG